MHGDIHTIKQQCAVTVIERTCTNKHVWRTCMTVVGIHKMCCETKKSLCANLSTGIHTVQCIPDALNKASKVIVETITK